ncbi:hypothetical protein P7C70_g875, partial [Phenoliferia sp. Uapishka_3]
MTQPAFPNSLNDAGAPFDAWANTLRPTTASASLVSNVGLPPLVACCKTLRDEGKIKLVQPQSWHWVAISHRWDSGVKAWEALPYRSHPGTGPLVVTGTSKEALISLAHLILNIEPIGDESPYEHFWCDTLCTDQKSDVDLARSIASMGDYYKYSDLTLIFPYGVQEVGLPFDKEGRLPIWHNRAWTLQEEVLAGSRAYFVVFDPLFRRDTMASRDEGDFQTRKLKAIAPLPADKVPGKTPGTTSFTNFRNFPPGHDDQLFLVPRSNMPIWRDYYIAKFQAAAESDDSIVEVVATAKRGTAGLAKQLEWSPWSALREMYNRQTRNPQDRVYGVLGLLDARFIPEERVTSGKMIDALVVLCDATHIDQRLLLTTIESYHIEDDGFSPLPRLDFRSPEAVPGPRLIHLRTLGVARFMRERGALEIISPSTHFRLDALEHDTSTNGHGTGIGTNGQRNATAEELKLLTARTGSFQHFGDKHQVKILAVVSPIANLDEEVILIAVTQCTMPTKARCIAPETLKAFEDWRSGVDMEQEEKAWCCIVCTKAGDHKQKVGLAVVRPAQFRWQGGASHLVR